MEPKQIGLKLLGFLIHICVHPSPASFPVEPQVGVCVLILKILSFRSCGFSYKILVFSFRSPVCGICFGDLHDIFCRIFWFFCSNYLDLSLI